MEECFSGLFHLMNNVMDQFASGLFRTCPYVVTVGWSRWNVGLVFSFALIGTVIVLFFRVIQKLVYTPLQYLLQKVVPVFYLHVQGNISIYYYFVNLIAILFSTFFFIIFFNLA